MSDDPRAAAARFYDLDPTHPNDLPFYIDLVESSEYEVLELGCGTGRILLPLSGHCKFIQGVDKSDAMIALCDQKLTKAGIPPTRARTMVSDISSFELEKKFDLIIAPYRVLQNLESKADIDGLFECIRSHLAQDGSCVLNVFNPRGGRQAVIDRWSTPVEFLEWEIPLDDAKLSLHTWRSAIDPVEMVLYPELIYRLQSGQTILEEVTLPVAMKCYWPDELVNLIEDHSFNIRRKWGGYELEEYGEGPELVIEFDDQD